MSRCIPQYIIQDTVTRKADTKRSKGTVKATILENDSKCKGMIALPFYDSKSVCFYQMHVIVFIGSRKLGKCIAKKKVNK